ERALDRLAVNDPRAGPAFWRVEHDHRPTRARGIAAAASVALDAMNLGDDLIERSRHDLMHLYRLVSFDEVQRPTVAAQHLLQFLMLYPREDGRVRNLVAVEMQNRQDGAVVNGIQKLVGMARCRHRPGL